MFVLCALCLHARSSPEPFPLFFCVFPLWHWQWRTFSSRDKLVSAPKNEFPGVYRRGGEGTGAVAVCGSVWQCCTLRGLSTAVINGKYQRESWLWTCQYKGSGDIGGWAVQALSWSPFAVGSRTWWGGTESAGSTDRFSMNIVSLAFFFSFWETVPCSLVSSDS